MVGSPWGPLQPDPFFTETTKIYQLALTNGLRSPFAPRDELVPDDSDEKPKDPSVSPTPAPTPGPAASSTALVAIPPVATNAPAPTKAAVPPLVIDLPDLAQRLYEVPAPPGNN